MLIIHLLPVQSNGVVPCVFVSAEDAGDVLVYYIRKRLIFLPGVFAFYCSSPVIQGLSVWWIPKECYSLCC